MPAPVTTPIVPADDHQVLPQGSGESAAVDEYSNLTEGKLAKRITSLLTYGLDVFDPSVVAQRKLAVGLQPKEKKIHATAKHLKEQVQQNKN